MLLVSSLRKPLTLLVFKNPKTNDNVIRSMEIPIKILGMGTQKGEALFSQGKGRRATSNLRIVSSTPKSDAFPALRCGHDSKLRRWRFRPIAIASWVSNTGSPSSESVEKRISSANVRRPRLRAGLRRNPAPKSRLLFPHPRSDVGICGLIRARPPFYRAGCGRNIFWSTVTALFSPGRNCGFSTKGAPRWPAMP